MRVEAGGRGQTISRSLKMHAEADSRGQHYAETDGCGQVKQTTEIRFISPEMGGRGRFEGGGCNRRQK